MCAVRKQFRVFPIKKKNRTFLPSHPVSYIYCLWKETKIFFFFNRKRISSATRKRASLSILLLVCKVKSAETRLEGYLWNTAGSPVLSSHYATVNRCRLLKEGISGMRGFGPRRRRTGQEPTERASLRKGNNCLFLSTRARARGLCVILCLEFSLLFFWFCFVVKRK